MLLVLAVLAITLALTYAMSRTALTSFKLSANQSASLRARSAAGVAASLALEPLAANSNWMPDLNPMSGTLSSGEPYQVDVQITDDGSDRSIAATAQVLDPTGKRTLAKQLLTVDLAKQLQDNCPYYAQYPTYTVAAIMAFAPDISATEGAPVYVAAGTTIRGNIRSKGTIQFQRGFALVGMAYAMGNVGNPDTNLACYSTYHASSGAAYQAEPLASRGTITASGQLMLSNVTLVPSSTNPMGVYYHQGNVLLDNNVTVTGTLVVNGDVTVRGTGVQLEALLPTTTSFKSCFPAMVVDGSIVFDPATSGVRISGIIIASGNVRRLNGVTPIVMCPPAVSPLVFSPPACVVCSQYSQPHFIDRWEQENGTKALTGRGSYGLFDPTGQIRLLSGGPDISWLGNLERSDSGRAQVSPRTMQLQRLGDLLPALRIACPDTARPQHWGPDLACADPAVIASLFVTHKPIKVRVPRAKVAPPPPSPPPPPPLPPLPPPPAVPQVQIKDLKDAIKDLKEMLKNLEGLPPEQIKDLKDEIKVLKHQINDNLTPDQILQIQQMINDLQNRISGPAIYVKGAIMAKRVQLQNLSGRAFALDFDPTRADITDAPGFFTWKAVDWTEGN
ncbi:MAG: hypothetical protein HY000_12925 [Planctomycetes bacterium]|nr:hypothetical protein [Planctomycetota bacterium]